MSNLTIFYHDDVSVFVFLQCACGCMCVCVWSQGVFFFFFFFFKELFSSDEKTHRHTEPADRARV